MLRCRLHRAFLVLSCCALASSFSRAQQDAPRLEVEVDRRFELCSLVQRLAGAAEYRRAPENAYTRAVDAHFAAFADHAAIKRTRELRAAFGISFDAPMTFAARLDPESFAWRGSQAPLPPGLDKRWKNAPIQAYAELLQDFARQSEFEAFFAKHQSYVAAVEDRYRSALRDVDVVTWFDGTFGARPTASFRLAPSLLNGANDYGVYARFDDGKEAIYQVLGSTELDGEGLPMLRAGLEALLVHELAHSYVNPVVDDRYAKLEAPFQRAFALDPAVMKKQAYANAKTVACESLVRAFTVLYLLEQRGEDRAATQLAYEEGRGFLWTATLLDELRRVRREPDSAQAWPHVVHEIPARLSAWLDLPLAQRRPPFRGPINGVQSWRGAETMALVLPSKSIGDPELTALVSDVEAVHSKIYAKDGVPLLREGELARASDPARAMVLYGTPATSALVKQQCERLDAHFDAAELKLAGRRFEGDALLIIACLPHPTDLHGAPILLYTARDLSTLIGANAVFHGPSDWLVARKSEDGSFETLAQGMFTKNLRGEWTLR